MIIELKSKKTKLIYFFKNYSRQLLLFLLLPLAFVLVLGFIYIPGLHQYTLEVIGFMCMTLAFVCVALFTKETKLYKLSIVAGYTFLAVFAFLKISFYKMYGVPISASALYVIFETNTEEASDYLQYYFDSITIGYAVVLLTLLAFLFFKLVRGKQLMRPFRLISYKLIYIIVAFACLFLVREYFRTVNIPYAALATWDDYKIAKKNLKDNLAQPTSPAFSNVLSKNEPQTYVVVIGESTSSWHMQLYGYERETNPQLNEIASELIVADSVISPHVHTILALDKILTLATFENKTPTPNGSVIQLANQAGFTTYWLSNQKPVGLHESIPTILGSAATKTSFVTTNDYNATIYDESLLPAIDKALADTTARKKILFIHLIGTHVRYDKRYPKQYEIFKDRARSLVYASEDAIEITNSYDNAVRYNDFIIRQVIEKLKNYKSMAALTYFSDHGDEVYDTMEFVGHNEYHATRPMYEVPFIFWFSEAYKQNSDMAIYKNKSRKFSLEDFPHTFATMSHITFNEYEPARSLLDSSFTERKRIIKDSIAYDQR